MRGNRAGTAFVGIVMGVVALVAGGASPAIAARPPLITNGGFESGLTGWTDTATNCIELEGGYVHSGSSAVLFGCTSQANVLSQTFRTRSGGVYQVTFYLAGGYNSGDTSGAQNFAATVAPAKTPSATQVIYSDTGNSNSNVSYGPAIVNTFTATSGTTLLSFTAQVPYGFYFLDDVSVVRVG